MIRLFVLYLPNIILCLDGVRSVQCPEGEYPKEIDFSIFPWESFIFQKTVTFSHTCGRSKFFFPGSFKGSLKIGYKCQRNIATISYTIRPDDLDFRGITCKAEVGEKKITFSSVSGLELEPDRPDSPARTNSTYPLTLIVPYRRYGIVHHRIVLLS